MKNELLLELGLINQEQHDGMLEMLTSTLPEDINMAEELQLSVIRKFKQE